MSSAQPSLLAQAKPSDRVSTDPDPGFSDVTDSLASMGETFLEFLPKLVIAIVVLAIFWVVGNLLRNRLEPRLARMQTPSFGRVFATLIAFLVKTVGIAAALVIAFPSVDLVTILGGLGVLGVAAGFAFQDILSNLLAGILLIFRQPFVSGDQIEVNDIKGTVEGITIRETRINTFDGRLVVVPNADVYTNAIEVQTAHDAVRSSFVTGVGYDTDLGEARRLTLETVRSVDGVLDEPAPEAYYTEHGNSAVILDVRYWTSPRQADIRRIQDAVTEALFDAYNGAGIDMPFDVVTLDAAASLREAVARDGRPA